MDQQAGSSKSQLGQMPQMMDFNPNMMDFSTNMSNFGTPQPKPKSPAKSANARSSFINTGQNKQPKSTPKGGNAGSPFINTKNTNRISNETTASKTSRFNQKPNVMSTPLLNTPKRVNHDQEVSIFFHKTKPVKSN